MFRTVSYLIDRYFIKQPRLRRLVTHLLEKDQNLEVSLFSQQVFINSIKEHGYLRASRLLGKSSLLRDEISILLMLAALLQDGDTFIDAGANIGIYSIFLSRAARLQQQTRFYAFEANPDTFARLCRNLEQTQVQGQHTALSDHEGTLQFVGGAVSHVFTTLENASDYSIPGETVSVPCQRLDAFPIHGDSLILKIDVEGQELKVLQGAERFFAEGRVKAVYLDGYKDSEVESFLKRHQMILKDALTLEDARPGIFNLLALRARDIAPLS